jgi:hypothetical protein
VSGPGSRSGAGQAGVGEMRQLLSARYARVLAVPLLTAAAIAGIVPTGLAAASPALPGSAAPFQVRGSLSGVAATSARNAWAVGGTNSGKTLIAHWNGTAWKRVTSPSPSGDDSLQGVAATSASNAWAVGFTDSDTGTGGRTLILHWNGSSWKRVPSPSSGTFAALDGVTATSARSAWAVGFARGGILILHWNGSSWRRVHSPGINGTLQSVAASSGHAAWAVGFAGNPGGAGIAPTNHPLILRWNGTAWQRVPTHLAPGLGNLRGVAVTASGTAWAAGCAGCSAEGAGASLIEQWNGTAWHRVPAPGPVSLSGLKAITATSASNAWAVGIPGGGPGHTTGIVHWNGRTWKTVPSPNPGGQEQDTGVAATSAGNAWAVGETEATTPFKGVISHWNGKTWN